MTEFNGLMPAIVTPMTAEGRFNEDAFRKVMEFNIKAGCHGFWVAGGTGESVHLDDDENKRIAEVAADQAAGRALNIMHVGAASTRRAAALAAHAAKAGADAICCVPPFFYPPTASEVVEHYKTVAEAADLPFFVYNLPQCTGTEITIELMEQIKTRVPQLKGLKHSALTVSNVREFAKMGLSTMVGNSSLMLPALCIGAVGCIDGPPTAAPEPWIDVWKAYNAQDLTAAQEAQDRASAVTSIVRHFGLHATCKFLVGHRLGIDCGDPRAPIAPLSESARKQVIERFETLELGAVSV